MERLGARFDKNPSERLAACCGRRVLHVNSLYRTPDRSGYRLSKCNCLGAERLPDRRLRVQDRDKDRKLGLRQRNFVLGIALTGKVPQTNPNTAWPIAQHFAGDIRDCGRRHGAKLAFGCTHQLDVEDRHWGHLTFDVNVGFKSAKPL